MYVCAITLLFSFDFVLHLALFSSETKLYADEKSLSRIVKTNFFFIPCLTKKNKINLRID